MCTANSDKFELQSAQESADPRHISRSELPPSPPMLGNQQRQQLLSCGTLGSLLCNIKSCLACNICEADMKYYLPKGVLTALSASRDEAAQSITTAKPVPALRHQHSTLWAPDPSRCSAFPQLQIGTLSLAFPSPGGRNFVFLEVRPRSCLQEGASCCPLSSTNEALQCAFLHHFDAFQVDLNELQRVSVVRGNEPTNCFT